MAGSDDWRKFVAWAFGLVLVAEGIFDQALKGNWVGAAVCIIIGVLVIIFFGR